MKLNYKRTLLIGIVFFGISVLNTMHDMSTITILRQDFPYLSSTVKGLIMAIDNMFALFMLPLFGSWSDRCNSKWGKRKPFVFYGTIGACASMMLLPVALGINSLPLFITFLCFFLIALGAYRSAGVSIVSDVTIKPLRSKANALINLMGAIAYLLGQQIVKLLFRDPVNGVRPIPLFWMYFAYAVVAIISLIIYMMFVREVKLTKERENLERELGIMDDVVEDVQHKGKIVLSKPMKTSLIFLLTSICLWTFGYNVLTTYWPDYAKAILQMPDGSYTMATTIAGAAGIIAYIPTGFLASKIGRMKTIMIGYVIACGACVSAMLFSNPMIMNVLFACIGIGQAMIVVNTLPMVVEYSTGNTIGQFTGFYYIATQLASSLTPLVGGVIFDICKSNAIAGVDGMQALFPYAAVCIALSILPMIFVKFGDSKPEVKASKLEMLEDL